MPNRGQNISLSHPNDRIIPALQLPKTYPKAVISGTTALALYKLTDERIDLIEVEIPNTTNIKNNIMKVHRVAKKNGRCGTSGNKWSENSSLFA
jgi:hypothetical protein